MPPGGLPPMKSAPMATINKSSPRIPVNTDFQRELPSLPGLSLDQRASSIPRRHSGVLSSFSMEPVREARTYSQIPAYNHHPNSYHQQPPAPYPQQPGPYRLHQPSRQSFSSNLISYDRTPFTNNHHSMSSYSGSGYVYGLSAPESDTKTRKRRGNLPKETTDKLRAWFICHLHHPYPTEDEKQSLMSQTGLQISECI
jgi:Homeobox KN domain